MYATEGGIEDGGLVAALRSIAGGGLSGLLAVQGDQDLVSMTFVDGSIVAVDAMNRPMEEVLSEVLAARGLVAPKRFAEVVNPHLGTGRLAGDVLVRAELLSRQDLLASVREQVRSQAMQLLRWEQGGYSFSLDAESPFHRDMEPVSVAELLMSYSENLSPDASLVVDPVVLDEHFEVVRAATSARILGRDGDWIEAEEAESWLTLAELRVLQSIDPSRPASHLLLDSGLSGEALRYALFILTQRGFIHPTGGAVDTESDSVRDLLGERGSISSMLVPDSGSGPAALVRETSDLQFDSHLLDSSSEQGFGAEQVSPDSDAFLSLGARFDVDPDASGERVERRETWDQMGLQWAARAMALGFGVLLVSQLILRAQRQELMYPFFWQARTAEQMETRLWDVVSGRLDRALRIYHLLYGRFPDDLEVLVDLELLSIADLYDSQGRWLSYSVGGDSYVLRPAEGDTLLERSSRSGSARGDLFLDSRFVRQVLEVEVSPVRLLD